MSDKQKKPRVDDEDELSRIDAMIAQHSDVFEGVPQLRYSRAVKYGEDEKQRSASGGSAVPHGNYRCHKCGEMGHFIQDCPAGTEEGKLGKVRQARGIPKTFLETVTEAEAAKSGGAFVSAEGDLVVMKTASKEERLRLVGSSIDVDLQRAFGRKAWEEVKKSISCSLCGEVAKNPVAPLCCGELFCRQCILTHLDRTIISLDESLEVRECPNCDKKGVVASDLVPVNVLASILGKKTSGIEKGSGGGSRVGNIDSFEEDRKKQKKFHGQFEVQLDDYVTVPESAEKTDGQSQSQKSRIMRHGNTVLVPGGTKNPFFEKEAPLLSKSEFSLWQERFREALRDAGIV